MCDFSLHAVRSRPAKVGDKLTVTFNPMRNGDNGGMFVNGKMGTGKVLTMSGGQGGGQ